MNNLIATKMIEQTINKDFVPYELALELKNIGFDDECLGWYWTSDAKILNLGSLYKWCKKPERFLAVPTYSQAFRFFREKYDIHYSINRERSQHDHKWGYNWSLYNHSGLFDEYLTSHPDAPAGEWEFETHEEAELACLAKMIGLVKAG